MRSIRSRAAVVLAARSLVAAAPAASVQADNDAPRAVATAKPCPSGFTRALLRGGHKCLRRGQFCRGLSRPVEN
jgi:hypothetical protein